MTFRPRGIGLAIVLFAAALVLLLQLPAHAQESKQAWLCAAFREDLGMLELPREKARALLTLCEEGQLRRQTGHRQRLDWSSALLTWAGKRKNVMAVLTSATAEPEPLPTDTVVSKDCSERIERAIKKGKVALHDLAGCYDNGEKRESTDKDVLIVQHAPRPVWVELPERESPASRPVRVSGTKTAFIVPNGGRLLLIEGAERTAEPRRPVRVDSITSESGIKASPTEGFVEVRVKVPKDGRLRGLYLDGQLIEGPFDTDQAIVIAVPPPAKGASLRVHLVARRQGFLPWGTRRFEVEAILSIDADGLGDSAVAPKTATIDLSQTNRVALVGVALSSQCTTLDERNIAGQVSAYFEEGKKRGLAKLDDRLGHFDALIRGFRDKTGSLSRTAVPSGILSVESDLPRIAGLLWSQGFGEALQLEISCSGTGPLARRTLVARRLIAREAVRATGGDDAQVVYVATATTVGDDDLRSLLNGPLSELYGLPFVAFRGGGELDFLHDPTVSIEVHGSDLDQLTYQFARVNDDVSICEDVQRFRSLVGREHPPVVQALGWDTVPIKQQAQNGIAQTDEAEAEAWKRRVVTLRPRFDFPSGGRYVIYAQATQRDGKTTTWASRCVDVNDAGLRISATAWYAAQFGDDEGEGSHDFGVNISIMPVKEAPYWGSFGGVIGYSLSLDRLADRPSWDDGKASAPARRIKWRRHGIELGVVAHQEVTWCFGFPVCPEDLARFSVYFQGAFLADFGIIDLSEIPAEWANFRVDADADILPDLDLHATLTAGLRARVSNRFDVTFGTMLAGRAFDDLVLTWSDQGSNVRRDQRFTWGGFVGGSYAP